MVRTARTFKAGSALSLLINSLCALLIVFLMIGSAEAALRATQYEASVARDTTSVSIRLDAQAPVRWFLLSSPYRLVVDLPRTTFALEHGSLKPVGLVSGVRYGHAGPDRSRLILSLNHAFVVKHLEVDDGNDGPALAIELKKASPAEFQTAVQAQVDSTASITPGSPAPSAAPSRESKRFTIVIDAGHGGWDGGAKGRNGTVEKEVTLAFAAELERILKRQKGYNILLTRSDDRFLRLDDRVEFARKNAADLFVSIHADTIRFRGLRGATVYTGSDKASDADSEALAERENLADNIPGLPSSEQNPDVADILNEFVRRETQGFSVTAAEHLVRHLAKSVGVINNPHRHARFRVLRAPDVPSVLVELGYLSNSEDERRLTDPAWRKMAAGSIAAAIGEFAVARTSGPVAVKD